MREKKLMDRKAASRIQRSTSNKNDGITPKGSFAARAMSAAYRNQPLTLNNPRNESATSLCCKIGIFAVGALTTAAASYYIYNDKVCAKL